MLPMLDCDVAHKASSSEQPIVKDQEGVLQRCSGAQSTAVVGTCILILSPHRRPCRHQLLSIKYHGDHLLASGHTCMGCRRGFIAARRLPRQAGACLRHERRQPRAPRVPGVQCGPGQAPRCIHPRMPERLCHLGSTNVTA